MASKDDSAGDMTVREAGRKGGAAVQHERDLRDRKEITDDPYNKPGPAEGHAYGIAAITQALSGLDFPVSKQELLKRAGSHEIEYHKGKPVSLRRIIDAIDVDEFPSMANVVEAASDALKKEGLENDSGNR